MHQFLKWMKGVKRYYLISLLVVVALQYFRTLSPLFIAHLVDTILQGNPTSLPSYLANLLVANTIKEQLILLGFVYIGISFVRVLLMFGRRLLNAYFTERIAYNMRNTLYNTLQDLSYDYHSHAETGDLIQRCTTDVETYRVFVGEQLIEMIRLVSLIGFSIYLMMGMSPTMTFYSLLVTPFIFTVALIYFVFVKKIFKKVEEAEARMTTTLQEGVTGIRVVKAFAKEQFEIDKFDKHSKEYLKEDFKLLRIMAIFWGGTDFVIFIQYCITLTMGILFTANGTLELGQFIAFVSYSGMIIWPMRQLGRMVGDFGKTSVALDRLDEIVLKKSEHLNDSTNEPEILGAVEFDHVSFKFDDETKPLLKDISFKVNKGETVAIVGKTGSGKSTLINLMIRLLDYQEGSIKFDGVDIKDINKKHLRKNVGIIMQEPFLYSRTVYENIGIMNKSAEKEQIYAAATIASLHDDINNFELGYETIVGERGVTLSGGQKQRVAIARMLLNDKPVLIFDDSLSAVDTETDIQIRRALEKQWKNTTVFIITHRITTAMEADKIIVLDKGEIAEMGTHDSLVKQGGIYAQLWDIQSNVEYDFKKIEEGVDER